MSKLITTPLKYDHAGQLILANDDALMVADIRGFGHLALKLGSAEKAAVAQDEIGQRLVDCWNACDGIADPLAVKDMLAALRELVILKDSCPCDYEERKPLAWQAARDALAKAKGES